MKIKILKNHGSTLVLVVIVIALITAFGTSILNISINHYKIKKSNSEIKETFYIAEDGLNKAYFRVFDLICEASEDSVEKADEFLKLYPEDYYSASNVYRNNYKSYIITYVTNRVYDNSNPYTEVINKNNLVFVYDKLIVRINSIYLAESGIEKSIAADIIISIPDYIEIKAGKTDFFSLICFGNFYF